MIYPLSIAFTIVCVLYAKWQFSDDRGHTQGRWHTYGALQRYLFIITAFVSQLWPSSWQDFTLAFIINIIIFEVGINKLALNQKWNYHGTTSKLDKKFGKVKFYVYGLALLAAVAIKIFL